MDILTISNIQAAYFKNQWILENVNYSVSDAGIYGIYGANGSGKTTFANSILNNIPYQKGNIIFKGENLTNMNSRNILRKGIRMLQQENNVFPDLSIIENIKIFNKRKRLSSMLTSEFGDFSLLTKYNTKQIAGQLSGGEKAQLALLMVLMSFPAFLILDEPFSGLSASMESFVTNKLRYYAKANNCSILIIEQNHEKLELLCDHIHEMKFKRLFKVK